MEKGRFEEAKALLEQQKSLPYISRDLNKVLDNINGMLYSSKRLYDTDLAIRAHRLDEATVILEDIAKDEKIPRVEKSTARRMLSRIEEMREKFN